MTDTGNEVLFRIFEIGCVSRRFELNKDLDLGCFEEFEFSQLPSQGLDQGPVMTRRGTGVGP